MIIVDPMALSLVDGRMVIDRWRADLMTAAILIVMLTSKQLASEDKA